MGVRVPSGACHEKVGFVKYVSLDLETTGLNPEKCNILMVSMVVEDTKNKLPLKELPHFTRIIKPNSIIGEPYALWLNGWILEMLAGQKEPKYPILEEEQFVPHVLTFLQEQFPDVKRVVLAGKNVGTFDMRFLPKTLQSKFFHRVLDPGSIFIDWNVDEVPPDMKLCKERVSLSGEVTHDAYEDALDVISLLRTRYVI